jgi:hypothetical protein
MNARSQPVYHSEADNAPSSGGGMSAGSSRGSISSRANAEEIRAASLLLTEYKSGKIGLASGSQSDGHRKRRRRVCRVTSAVSGNKPKSAAAAQPFVRTDAAALEHSTDSSQPFKGVSKVQRSGLYRVSWRGGSWRIENRSTTHNRVPPG